MIECCHYCEERHAKCHDTCAKYKAEKELLQAKKEFLWEQNKSYSVYHADRDDKRRLFKTRRIRGEKQS